jgi:hypothetical protein
VALPPGSDTVAHADGERVADDVAHARAVPVPPIREGVGVPDSEPDAEGEPVGDALADAPPVALTDPDAEAVLAVDRLAVAQGDALAGAVAVRALLGDTVPEGVGVAPRLPVATAESDCDADTEPVPESDALAVTLIAVDPLDELDALGLVLSDTLNE